MSLTLEYAKTKVVEALNSHYGALTLRRPPWKGGKTANVVADRVGR